MVFCAKHLVFQVNHFKIIGISLSIFERLSISLETPSFPDEVSNASFSVDIVYTHGGVLLLVKLHALAFNFTKSNTPPWVYYLKHPLPKQSFMYRKIEANDSR